MKMSCCLSSWLDAVDTWKAERAEAEDRAKDEDWLRHSTAVVFGGQGTGMKDISSVLMLACSPGLVGDAVDSSTTAWQELPVRDHKAPLHDNGQAMVI